MSALSAPCWTNLDARAILRTEALSGEDEVFLATHTPVESFDVEGSHATDVKSPTERGLLNALSDPNLQHAWCVIQGEPGSGKSHVIRWLDVNWPEPGDQRLLIQRANGSLDGTLRQLQRNLPTKFQHLFDGLKQQQAAGLSGRSMHFLTSLGVSLHPDYFDVAPADVDWCRKYEPEKLILNTEVRENWKGPRRVLEIMNGGDARNSESASFVLQDVVELVDYCVGLKDSERSAALARRLIGEAVHVREALDEGRTWEEISTDKTAIPDSLKLVDSLNARRNHAVQSVIGVSADGLKRLFEDLRTALKADNRRLVLLLEDVTSWQGVDDSLIDVLTTDATTRPEKDLCPLISVVGVTPDYYEQDLRGNYQQRITLNIRLGKDDGRFEEIGTLNRPDKRARFVSKYLSAARAGERALKSWREDIRSEPDLAPPNPCIPCPRSEVCHAVFGEVDGVGLFPFTQSAVDTFFAALKSDARGQTFKTPRGLLQGVLSPTLLNAQVLDEGLYPGPQIEPSFIQRVPLAPLIESRINSRVGDDAQRARLRRLFSYWGDNRAGLRTGSDGELEYAGLTRDLVEAFDLPWVAEDAQIEPQWIEPERLLQPGPEQPAEENSREIERRRIEGIDAGATALTTRREASRPSSRAAPAGPKPQGRRELEARLAEIESLGSDDALPNAPRWNALVYDVMQTIDFRRLNVDRWTFDKVFTAESVKIEGTGKLDQRHMAVPRAEWLAQGLKAYASLKTDNADLSYDEIEHARRRLAALVQRLERLARDHLSRRLSMLDDGQAWKPATAVVQVLLARTWLRGGVLPTAPLADQWEAILSDESETDAAPMMRTQSWQDVLTATGRRHSDLRAMLHDMVSLPQGRAKNFGLSDLSIVLAAMVDLMDTLKLGATPVEGDGKPPLGDLPVVREVATKVAAALPKVVTFERELLARRSASLAPLLRDQSIATHIGRVDHVVKVVSGALPTKAAVEARDWMETHVRARRLIDDRPALLKVQQLIGEIEDAAEQDLVPVDELAWLINAPAGDLKTLLDVAQKGEATLEALAPHVLDLVQDAKEGVDLQSLHRRGETICAAADAARATVTTAGGAL